MSKRRGKQTTGQIDAVELKNIKKRQKDVSSTERAEKEWSVVNGLLGGGSKYVQCVCKMCATRKDMYRLMAIMDSLLCWKPEETEEW